MDSTPPVAASWAINQHQAAIHRLSSAVGAEYQGAATDYAVANLRIAQLFWYFQDAGQSLEAAKISTALNVVPGKRFA